MFLFPSLMSHTSSFLFSYLKEFGFTIPDRPIMVDDIRVRGCGKSGIKSVYKTNMGPKQAKPVTVYGLTSHKHRPKYFVQKYTLGHALSFNLDQGTITCVIKKLK